MSTTKHQFFTISINVTDNINFEQKAIDVLNKFLLEENVVYVNHTFSILTNPKLSVSKRIDSYNHIAVVSLIYKDLKETEMDLSKASKKIIKNVKKSIENGSSLPQPSYETSFEKKIKEQNNKKV